ncbi:hypothetical protein [Methylomonas fluvii]|uniref:Uncharacterized protein n=1 Tax=Methylomonas fluvii TaxID=1854564 RepID=A0ABR9D9P0_9GAMM|nr:hypothetical protein [Methylomonas fluvii]MBD9359665.1 hypothetical protein [Methylomonas fluvii]CAD6872411.1 hypothetical protein [Methylomonas fluvii]
MESINHRGSSAWLRNHHLRHRPAFAGPHQWRNLNPIVIGIMPGAAGEKLGGVNLAQRLTDLAAATTRDAQQAQVDPILKAWSEPAAALHL